MLLSDQVFSELVNDVVETAIRSGVTLDALVKEICDAYQEGASVYARDCERRAKAIREAIKRAQ